MALDPYGFPTDDVPAPRMGLFARLGVTVAWLALDLVVGVCSAGFAALAWDTPEDPPFIGFFSSPFWGMGLAGTAMAMFCGAIRLHPALQAVLSLVAAVAGCAGLPLLWFAGIVIADL